LLKNGPDDTQSNNTTSHPLPLYVTKHKSVTLIGPLADEKEVLLGNYHGIPSHVTTPLQGLVDLKLDVNFIRGSNVTDTDDGRNLTEEAICKQFGFKNDATILIVGLDQTIESEEIDRISLLLPKIQRDLVAYSSRCSKSLYPNAPVILVAVTGGPLDVSEYKTSHFIDAILYTSYPGQAGGNALASLLYGKYNPSGRLVTNLYHDSYTKVPLKNMRMRPDEAGVYPGRTYRFYNDDIVYPFGYGLSYTTWKYVIQLAKADKIIYIHVTNTGTLDGSDTILLFHRGPNYGTGGKPIKSLIGFEKAFVSAHNSQTLSFS
jgi:beta-D-xylosidase 4